MQGPEREQEKEEGREGTGGYEREKKEEGREYGMSSSNRGNADATLFGPISCDG